VFGSDPIAETNELLRSSRETLRRSNHSLRETMDTTRAKIDSSHEKITRTDFAIRTWGGLASIPTRISD
jgi:hypothetical protein